LAFRKFALDATVLTFARIFQASAGALVLPVLARLLQPSDFGLMAATNSILFLANILAHEGFANSLVRTDFREKTVWSSVFWVTTAWSACLTLLVATLAVPVGWLLKQPNVAPLIVAMSIVPFGVGLLATPVAELQQRKQFGWLSASDILGSVAGIAAAVVFAVAGAGPWALVAQSLIAFVVRAVVIVLSTRFRPSLAFDRHLIGEHLHFARNTGAFAVALFFSTQMDNVMIARSSGSGPLGVYSMASRVTGLLSLLGTAYSALYPRLVKLQQDKQALRQLVLMSAMVLAILLFPPTAMLCVSGSSVFTVIFSDRWSDVATVFSYLAPVGALQAVGGIHVAVLMAVGRTDVRLRLTVEFAILWLIVLVSVAHLGIQAVAIGSLVTNLVYYPRFLSLFLKPIDGRVIDYIGVMLVPFCVSAAVALLHVAFRGHFVLSPLLETCLAALETAVAYGVIGLLMRRRISEALMSSRVLIGRADEEL
jgi:O-antigen/teichoic acid export membrane protein